MCYGLNAFSRGFWIAGLRPFSDTYGTRVPARRLVVGVMDTAHNVGGALIPLVMAAVALHYGWRVRNDGGQLLAIGVGMVLCWRLRVRSH